MAPATPTHCMLYVTTASKDDALRIGRTLVQERLAACANILGDVHSVYRWQDAIEESAETVLIAKTRRELAEKAIARVEMLHSYDVPCAVAYNVAVGLPAYLAWIDEATM